MRGSGHQGTRGPVPPVATIFGYNCWGNRARPSLMLSRLFGTLDVITAQLDLLPTDNMRLPDGPFDQLAHRRLAMPLESRGRVSSLRT